MTEKKILWR